MSVDVLKRKPGPDAQTRNGLKGGTGLRTSELRTVRYITEDSMNAAKLNGTVPGKIAEEIRGNSSGTLIIGEFPLRKLSIPEIKHFGNVGDQLPPDSTRLSTLIKYGGTQEASETLAAAGGKFKPGNGERVPQVHFKDAKGSKLIVFGGGMNTIQVTRENGEGDSVVAYLDNPIIHDITDPQDKTPNARKFELISAPTTIGDSTDRIVTVVTIGDGKVDVRSFDADAASLSERDQSALEKARFLKDQHKPALVVQPSPAEAHWGASILRDWSEAPGLYVNAADIREVIDEIIDPLQQEAFIEAHKIVDLVRLEEVRRKHRATVLADFGKIRAATRLHQNTSE